MNTKEIASEYRLTHWAGIMRDRQESGLSIKAYSKAAGFHENVYFYWQRKLRKVALDGLTANTSIEASTSHVPSVPSGWALCGAAKATDKEKPLAIEIGSCRVLASTEVNPELLLKVCRVLVQI